MFRAMLPWIFALLAGCGPRADDPAWLMAHGSQRQKIEFINHGGPDVAATRVASFLEDDDPWVVANACARLGQLRAREFIPSLVALLSHAEPNVANLAAAGLSRMVDSRDVAILPDLYRNLDRKELLVRMSAIEAIGAIRQPQSIEVLTKHLVSEDPAGRMSVYSALGAIGDERGLPALRAALAEVEAMDHGVPDHGHSRGQAPHPDLLESVVRGAIENIERKTPGQ